MLFLHVFLLVEWLKLRNMAGPCDSSVKPKNAPIQMETAPLSGANAPIPDVTHSFGACRHDLLA
jgi:hypothetical protein